MAMLPICRPAATCAACVKHAHIDSRASALVSEPGFTGSLPMPSEIRADRPAGFGLPPMIDDWHLKLFFCPGEGVGIGALAGQEQSAEFREVVFADVLSVGIIPLDRAKCRRRREERLRRGAR